MKNNKKNKTVVALVSAILFVSAFMLVGCGNNSANILNTLTINMSKTINTLESVQDMETNELIIEDFMNENELSIVNASYVQNENSTQAMGAYVAKITALNNSVITTVNTNNELNLIKKEITQKASRVKFLCNQSIDAKCTVPTDVEQCLKEINNTLMANVTRVGLTRNEISNNYKRVAEIKDNYGSQPERLNSRYAKLNSSLNTRLSYYNNIQSSLDSLELSIKSLGACIDCNEVDQQQTQKTSIQKNIDTYENAGTNMFGDFRNNPVYNPDNYLKNYYAGYGMNGFGNPYNMNGYGMNGYGYGGYAYGAMPNYGYGGYGPFGGYVYPNINTFGTYKNIDTYKSRKEINKEELESNVQKEQEETKERDVMPQNLNDQSKELGKKEKATPLPHELIIKEDNISDDQGEQSEQFVTIK